MPGDIKAEEMDLDNYKKMFASMEDLYHSSVEVKNQAIEDLRSKVASLESQLNGGAPVASTSNGAAGGDEVNFLRSQMERPEGPKIGEVALYYHTHKDYARASLHFRNAHQDGSLGGSQLLAYAQFMLSVNHPQFFSASEISGKTLTNQTLEEVLKEGEKSNKGFRNEVKGSIKPPASGASDADVADFVTKAIFFGEHTSSIAGALSSVAKSTQDAKVLGLAARVGRCSEYGDKSQNLAVAKRIRDISGASSSHMLEAALIFSEAEQHDDAEALFRKAIEANPKDSDCLLQFAHFTEKVRGNKEEASKLAVQAATIVKARKSATPGEIARASSGLSNGNAAAASSGQQRKSSISKKNRRKSKKF